MTADILVENHGSIALFTPLTPDAADGSKCMSRSSRGNGSAVPSPLNPATWTDSLKGCRRAG
jgi:hypothetical protein